MLESVVADLLNKFLGDYVENLDRSQLKLGIWGGNVSLENLRIRENALSELDVPFKVKAGLIEKLTLKIPWKNLYGDAVVATLEGLYLLVVPGASMKYDAEKEERNLQEAKQRELQRIEEALQKASEKDKPKEEKKDTFLEKLAAQVIKNLQVKITNIHIRYEDDISDVSLPVSVGITLAELSLQTSNESWTPCILNEAAKIIYKLVRLDSFGTYWNVKSEMYYHQSMETILADLKSSVRPGRGEPKDYQYIFKPVSASAKLYLNPEAELELRTPKLDWNMEVQHVAIELTKPQYLSMIDLLESVDYMVRNVPYRKYRPGVTLEEDSRKWWDYAITSILEVHVRRRTHMWTWSNIAQHRENLKAYKNVYKVKLTQSKVPEETLKQLQALESKLDVFNIILGRQQAQAEVVRSGQKVLAKKSGQSGEKKSGGWFGGFWGKKDTSSKKDDSDELSVPEKIEDLMTPEEKKKLFTAIGYSETSHNLTLPRAYVAHILGFKLVSTSITIRDEAQAPETLKIQIIDLSTKIFQRPGAQALKVDAKLEHWYVTGLRQQNVVPSLVSSIGSSESSLLKIQFETNPENGSADQVLILQSQPVEIIYDAVTINALAEFFQPHRGMDLEQLTSATLMKLEEIKEKTAAGLTHMIETRKVLDLRINLQPSFLLLPRSGFYYDKADVIIVDFGSFQLNSITQGSHAAANTSSLEELMDKAYDKFHVQIKKVQMLFGTSGEDWKKARAMNSSSLHILQPLDIDMTLGKAMVERDSRMPRFKVSGELPLLRLRVSDRKLQGVCEVVSSIPLPQPQPVTPATREKRITAAPILSRRPEKLLKQEIEKSLFLEDSSDSDEEFFDTREADPSFVKSKPAPKEPPAKGEGEAAAQTAPEELTDLHLKFEVKEVILELTKQQQREEKTVLVFRIQQLGTEACLKTFDLQAVSYLRTISLDYYDLLGLRTQPLHLINSSDIEGRDLLKVEYIKADKNGPKFQTTFENTEQVLKVVFSSVELLLHSQALLSAISFITESMQRVSDKTEPPSLAHKQPDKETFVSKATKPSRDKDLIAFKLFAKLNSFSLNVWDENNHIAEIKILGLDSSVFLESSKIDVFARLKDILVNDVNPHTIHKKAVCIMEDEVFSFNLTLYPEATQGEAYKDVTKVDGKISLRVGCMRIVFLNKFIGSLVGFLNNFQAAKERVSAATAQAAQRAASSVKDLAERSFRLLMDIHLKAPVIVIPQSSLSSNALVADLGLIKIQNEFRLISSDEELAPIIDCMIVSLTDFKLSRTVLDRPPAQSDIQLLYPISLSIAVNRNLAASWYHQIPVIEVKGHLNSMDVCVSQEDLNVLFRVLVENLGEGGEDSSEPGQVSVHSESVRSTPDGIQVSVTDTKPPNESSSSGTSSAALNLLLNFEIKKVLVQLMSPARGSALHDIQISQLGLETRVGSHEMTAAVYLQRISMTCNDFRGPDGGTLLLVNSSDDTKEHLLTMEYVKADRDGPGFRTVHNNTVQRLNASMSSLNVILHTQALLSLLNFLSGALPSGDTGVTKKTKELKSSLGRQKSLSAKPGTALGSAEEDIFDLKLSANLNAFNVFVCDETCNIADIRIQGMDASYAVQAVKQDLFARLRDIVVINVDPKTIHRQAVYILGEEVFSLRMTLFPEATEGSSYSDMSAIDGEISLRVGCIHIVYLHKFLMSLLNFFNTFQAAKEALSSATAQAAEKAASSMKDLAQKSFRLAMDIDLKAPVIHIPQSSVSSNIMVADLGLIRVRNKFCLVPDVSCPLPPVIDRMDIQLTELKLLRTALQTGSPQPELEILQPVNLIVSVQRNISSSWYSQIPAIQIDGDLKPMQVALSQDDLTVLMNVLFENLSEAPSLQSSARESGEEEREVKETSALSKQRDDADRKFPASPPSSSDETPAVMLKFTFNFESLSVMLYNNDACKVASQWLHDENLRLGELRFHRLSSSGTMNVDNSLDFSICLKTCTLDDLREGVTRATSRMIDQKDSSSSRNMIEISYNQGRRERSVSAIMDKLYVCASVEFLMTVADFFIKAMHETANTEKPVHSQPKPSNLSKTKADKGEPPAPQTLKVTAIIMDPEIVFVANLTKADAPALAVSFQGNFLLSHINAEKKITAMVKEFKVLACPFLRELRGSNVTTVVQPCSLQLESRSDEAGSQEADLTIEEVIIKISPIILNTVLTIMAVLKPKPKEDESKEQAVDLQNIWGVRTWESGHSWFLGVESADEVTECFQNTECAKKKEEAFNVSVKSVQVTLECGRGHRTVPLLLVESTFNGTIKNWTSLMNVTADTTLEVHYYNEMFAVWEPLIERVDGGKRCWSLKLEMKNNPIQDRSLLPGDDFIVVPEPQSAISVTSKDTMNITVSKCTLGVFSNLAKAFSEGTASTFDYSLKDKAPLMVMNALGVPLVLQHGPNLRPFGSSAQETVHNIGEGQSMELEFSVVEPLHHGRVSALHRQESSLFTLGIVPQGYTEVANIPVTRPARRLYNVRSPLEENCVSIVVQVDASEGNKVLFIRSPLQIKNHFSVPFIVYKFVANAKLLELLGVCKPDEEFHVPLHSYRCQLFLKPAGPLDGQFKESTSYMVWKEMLHRSSEVQCTLQCPASETNFLPFIINCTAVPDHINFITSNGEKDWDPAYIIHLYPSLTIRNLLPYSLRYLLEGTADAHMLAEGSACDVLHSRISGEIMELVMIKYQGRNWNGHFRVHENLPEFFHVTFTAETAEVMTADLSVHVKRVGNRMVLSVFSPYWIINKTSRILQYRAEEIHVKHPSDYRDVILFSFRKKNIFSKNKIQLCISTSSWSSGFSLDTVGSYGCVKCPAGKMQYLVGVNIQMSSFNLTRIVTLTPFYTLVNNCTLELEVGEMEADGSLPELKWHYIGASECVPFWPENVSGKMCVRIIGCDGVSKPFFFNKQDNGTLLSLETMNSGLMVDVSISDHSIVIRFSDYYEGAAPALIMNHTPRAKLTYGQSGTEEEKELRPGEARLFAWEDPTGTKKLSWTYSQTKGELDLLKDESGQFPYNPDTQIHWVSFLDGRQRILLFTEDVALVTKARQAEEMEQPDQEINISIHSLGLSLINNESKQEISYIGITSSGVIWELMPKQKWKPFSQKHILQLEQAYERSLTGEQGRWSKIDNNFEVSFGSMEMRLPLNCKIRRSFLSGIHVEFKQSPHQRSLRAQLYWLQVDNQLPGSMFPAVFHPVAPPKSIALDSEPKPFIDISIITRFNEFSKVTQFKYFMVLIQCMALKVDQGFLAAVIGLFTPTTPQETERQRTKLIQKDLDSLNQELMESSLTDITTLSFFEHFHISPVKLHLSLSLGAGGEESNKEEQEIVAISSVNLLLKSIGATLTDVDDLIFKLACFEVKYQFYKRNQLRNLVIRHYTEQFLKQLYVLVLGLDVLGNPFGLIRGLSEGVEAFFYEPFQGAVQGPEEFAEGLVIGVRSLLGHTVGGAAGVVSRITGSVGKGLAAITMDKEYQQKRREEMGRQPKDFGDSLAKGGKGLLMGVVGGVTGIITKPVEGAKKEGAAGFFKGIGKGLVGVVARPTGGIIDMASSTFQGIQRVAESTEDVSPLRPTRFIHEDGIIRPYDQSQAQGLHLFENSNIKMDGEIYRFCCPLDKNSKVNLVVTNRRIMSVKEMEILGNRVVDWDYSFEEFMEPPTVEDKVLTLSVKDKSLLVFQKKENRSQEVQRRITLQNDDNAQEVLKALDEAWITRRQQTLVRQKSERFIKQFSS